MTTPTDHTAGAIAQAEADLHGEHARLAATVQRLMDTSERSELLAVLDGLHAMLHRHFQADEYPGGLYDRLGATSPRFRDEVRELVDDHFRILGTLRGLSSRLRAGDGDLETILRQRGRIATWLAEHEKREHDMADAARRLMGD